tara:strand:+ start:1670 stop:2512 length:843 start_codon:yes stop_codon:yes gene_type:complete
MKIEVNIRKKYFFSLLSVLIILGIVAVGVAYGGNTPSVMGHSFGEIELPSCGNQQVLKFSSGVWACGDDNSGGAGGGGGDLTVSNEVICSSVESVPGLCDLGSTSEWAGCFLSGTGGTVGTSTQCRVLSISGQYKLSALSAHGATTNCYARCVKGGGSGGGGAVNLVSGGTGINVNPTVGNVVVSLRNPTSSTIGGVKSRSCPGSQVVTGIDTSGNVECGSTGAAICTWEGTTYSTSAKCRVGCYDGIGTHDEYTCQGDGSWSDPYRTSSGDCDMNPCGN